MLPILNIGPLALQTPGLILLAGLWLGWWLAGKMASKFAIQPGLANNLVFAGLDLVSTRFLNADSRLQLETPSPDCNPEIMRLVGLDDARLARMLRLIRLQRRLGWSFNDIDRALMASRQLYRRHAMIVGRMPEAVEAL